MSVPWQDNAKDHNGGKGREQDLRCCVTGDGNPAFTERMKAKGINPDKKFWPSRIVGSIRLEVGACGSFSVKSQSAKNSKQKPLIKDGFITKRHSLPKRTLKIVTWNIQRIQTNLVDVITKIEIMNIDIIIVAETMKKRSSTEEISDYNHI